MEVDGKLEARTNLERRAKPARRASRYMPKASALRFHPSNGSRLNRALLALRKCHGFCVTGGHLPIASEPTPSPRLWATAPGATPARLCNHTMKVSNRPSKPELPTWLGTGTFYLAPTRNAHQRAFALITPLFVVGTFSRDASRVQEGQLLGYKRRIAS